MPISTPIEKLDRRTRGLIALGLIALGCFFALLLFLRNSRLTTPMILGDEYYYSRQMDPQFSPEDIIRTSQVPVPRSLILAVWHGGFHNPSDVYFTAKCRNALLFACLLAPLFSIARRLGVSPGHSVFLAGMGMLLPFHLYTSFFMPEPAFALTFWLAVAAYLAAAESPSVPRLSLCGLALAAHFLVKPHGVILAATILVVHLISAARERRLDRFRRGLVEGGILLVTFLLLVIAGGLFLSGHSVSLGLYGSLPGKLAGTQPTLAAFDLATFLGIAGTHALIVLGIFGWTVPWVFWRARSGDRPDQAAARFSTLIAFYLPVQILFVSWYTLTNGEAGRLHLRYYDFAFPAFLLLMGAPLTRQPGRTVRWVCAALGAAAAVAFWWGPAKDPGAEIRAAFYCDAPELILVHAGPAVRGVLLAACVLGGVALIRSNRSSQAGRVAGQIFLSLVILASAVLLHQNLLRQNLRIESEREAGLWLRLMVPPELWREGAAVGAEKGRLFATLFFFPGTPEVIPLQKDSTINLQALARRYAWVYLQTGTRYRLKRFSRFPSLASRHGVLIDLTRRDLFQISPPSVRPGIDAPTPRSPATPAPTSPALPGSVPR